MRNGLVYKKYKSELLFYVPSNMEVSVIRSVHDEYGHLEVEKTSEMILKTFWFPNWREKVRSFISNCLKCISNSPVYGKKEGELRQSLRLEYRLFQSILTAMVHLRRLVRKINICF